MVGNKKPPPAQLAARGLRVDAGTLYAPSTNALTKYYRHPAGLHSSTVVSAQVRRQIPRGDDSDGSTTAPGKAERIKSGFSWLPVAIFTRLLSETANGWRMK
jgi:hypothetical protein